MLKGIFSIELSIGWSELEQYLKTTENYMQKAKTDIKDKLDKEAKGLSSSELIDFYTYYEVIYDDYDQTFPAILRNSFLASAYSLFENKLDLTCNHLQNDQGLSSRWNDESGSKLDKFKAYCKKARFPLSFTSQEWIEIKKYSLVRNCIVHNNGLIKGFRGEQKLLTYADLHKIISGDSSRPQIALTTQFCKDVTKTMWQFLEQVITAYKSQKQKPKRAAGGNR